MNALNLEPLRAAVHEAAVEFFRLCVDDAGEDSISGLALCPDNDVSSFFWMASTNEAIDQQAKEWLAEINEAEPSNSYTIEFAQQILKYEVTDWRYSEEDFDCPDRVSRASNMLHELWAQFKSGPGDSTEAAGGYQVIADQFRTAMGEGLGRFNDGYNYKVPRDEFILLVYDPDPLDPEAIRGIAQSINPSIPFESFSSVYQMETLEDEEP